jgi:hypothetical protein
VLDSRVPASRLMPGAVRMKLKACTVPSPAPPALDLTTAQQQQMQGQGKLIRLLCVAAKAACCSVWFVHTLCSTDCLLA